MVGTSREVLASPRLKKNALIPKMHQVLLYCDPNDLEYPGMSYQTTLSKSQVPRSPGTTQDIPGCPANMTTKISGPNIPGSPGTTTDILGCPTKHDYQSPSLKIPRNPGTTGNILPNGTTKVPGPKIPRIPWTTRDIPEYPRMSYQTTRVPGPNIPRYPETARDIPRCPTKHDYQSPRSQVVLGQLRTSRDVLQT